ncbi:hypothetical protein R5W23_006018 [Gemmata sp. JC673]|uniref:DUF3995 domain-containing protein n=1 Tax=Gemmata algarum TaxID=2975278 RepID=A0ABU5ESJ2_9BACT|nr:hypothetical protein [Gemmata algarum]MDY3557918.1 hypothetical protein [Gemmata algarum]
MHALAIVAFCVVVAVLYGIAHDQVTARVCIEYFTIGHPPVFGTDDPTLLGLGWGIIATWWVGAILGLLLAVAARAGRRRRRAVGSLVRPVGQLLLVLGAAATVAGSLAWLLASAGGVVLVGRLANEVPPERHVAFLSAMWVHSASYLFGFFGGAVLCVRVWRERKASGAE